MFFKEIAFYFFFCVILYNNGLQSMYRFESFGGQNNSSRMTTSMGIFETPFERALNDLNTEIKNGLQEVITHINIENAKIVKVVNNMNGTINLFSSVIHGEALQDINERAQELHHLKNQLLNQLMHLKNYRKTIEDTLRLHNDRLEKLEPLNVYNDCLEKLHLLYTQLRFDVNLVNLEDVKKQIHLFYSSAEISLSKIESCLYEMQKIKEYLNQVNSDIKKLNDDILNRLDINTKAMNDMQHVHKKTMYSMAGVCGVLFLLILYQQYQLYCL